MQRACRGAKARHLVLKDCGCEAGEDQKQHSCRQVRSHVASSHVWSSRMASHLTNVNGDGLGATPYETNGAGPVGDVVFVFCTTFVFLVILFFVLCVSFCLFVFAFLVFSCLRFIVF